MPYTPRAGLAVLILAIAGAGTAHAQTDELEEPLPPPRPQAAAPELRFAVHAGVEHQFDATFDDAGEVGVTRYGFGLDASRSINDDVSLSMSFGYELDDYDFSGTAGFGGLDAWDNVHFMSASARLNVTLNDDWSAFGGGVFQAARENDADWGDSILGGGLLGAVLRVDESLTLGGGVGVVSQIEDNARIFPVIIVDADLAPGWRLTSRTGGASGLRSGLEVIYDFGEGWDFGVGGAYDFRRFRLDDQGIAPNGVGEQDGLAFWIRLGWARADGLRVSGHVGLTIGSEFTLEDSNGNEIAKEEHDSAAFVGISATVPF